MKEKSKGWQFGGQITVYQNCGNLRTCGERGKNKERLIGAQN